MKKNTLLIIDDVPSNVKVLHHFLTALEFDVLIAEDGEEGIQVAEHSNPDLILLDVMMPGMNGFEVCERMKSQKSTQDIPIIFMTALADTVDKVKGFKLGAADYITKPFQQEEVYARINAHITIRKQQQQLQKRNMELDAFAHTVAHDLKNPLSGIVTLSGFLLEQYSETDPLGPKGIKNMYFLEKSGRRAMSIIKALLMLSGVSRQSNVILKPLDMNQIISQILEEYLASMVKEYQGQIKLPNTWPIIAQGYAPWIEEIWVNYLSNGLKYGGTPPHLTLGTDTLKKGMVRFWVRDNGPGLSKEAIAQLFTPFTRLHHQRAEGHGLGLSIVQQIVEKLGGQAGVESEEGQGSLFYFTLPTYNAISNV
ncbi:hybrid sensor histidine kinase/response regulator [Candidatus Parabeggiatoa sp. HSG14]|uniref:hybrid sensor histidine kinase/response regulator n=1 Tax=Candidatus Parabeggiatoa sp. HSG14 TaxID=3055593 RepID=UPI0025A7C0CC|nr:hybrid sensor histidine kinase/response regulator [Thiotrichales bacterium HSG14]